MTVGYVQVMFLDPRGKRIQPAIAVLACGGDVNSPPLGSIPELFAQFTGASDRVQTQHASVGEGSPK